MGMSQLRQASRKGFSLPIKRKEVVLLLKITLNLHFCVATLCINFWLVLLEQRAYQIKNHVKQDP